VKKRFLPLAISLLAASVLAFVVEGFIQRALVAPLLYVFWFITLLFSSVPQVLYWAAFIITALVIASLSVPRAKPVKTRDQASLSGNQGAVAAWAALLRVSRESGFSRQSMAQALRRLSRDLMFPDEHVGYHELEARIEQTSSALPPEIAAYFQAHIPETRSRFRPGSRSHALDLDPQHVVAYLENKLDPLAGE
jgi:uncharacterized membrane protein YccC